MDYIAEKGRRQFCAFAFFNKDGELIGYRQDTFNTIGTDSAKVYGYDPDQIKVVVDNVTNSLNTPISPIAEWVKEKDPKLGVQMKNHMRNNYRKFNGAKEIEMRVLPAPEREPMVPPNLDVWLLQAPSLTPLEVHKIKINEQDTEDNS